ncbi:aryl-sulfate sulfotransferase [Aquimarina sediminis]|uniref:aryl-sulfate sulfotransferase n=1 Tax=Aquimarina sediminis TaxID=2070536 RepID=UPI000CA03BEF|nr:aryl-sulfate sulfotransferase [Aquimarina sediminis]
MKHLTLTSFYRIVLTISSIFAIYSCSDDDESIINEETPIPISSENPIAGDTGMIITLDSSKIQKGLILVNDIGNARVYLMNKLDASIAHEWNIDLKLGNDVELLDNGKLLASLKDKNALYDIGGYAGKIQLINPDSSIEWEYTYSDEFRLSHHDIELLPNGNILILAWEIKSLAEAEEAGYDLSNTVERLFPESLIEVDPNTDQIVWQWNSWDHLIQDHDISKNNYGEIDKNPQLIDINYHYDERGDLMHANGIDYDSEKDLIYLSINFYSEIWVIDHSTTTAEASSHASGNYNKGGDLVYRFGNPTAYKNTKGTRLFYNNHFPNILDKDEIGAGNLLVYMNGNIPGNEQSTVYELKLPDNFGLAPDQNNEPTIIWEFSDKELYSPLVSGAVRLSNGNTLITEGSFGFWEVNENKEVIWQFDGVNSFFWRGYHYDNDHPAILNLNL